MHDQVGTAIHRTLDELFPSLEEYSPRSWDDVVADTGVAGARRPSRGLPRSLALRLAVVGAAAAAIALGVFNVLPGNNPSAVERATAALAGPGDAILHVRAVGSFASREGSVTTWPIESWQQNSPPYDSRLVVSRGGGIERPELATAGGVREFYDPRENTIYTVRRQGKPGAERGLDPLAPDFSVHQLRDLLGSGEAREDGRVRIDGRDAVRIVSTGSGLTLLVDSHTYEPIEWHVITQGRVVTMRVRTYEWVPATAENRALLSLRAQHPGAGVRVARTDETARADGDSK